MRGAAMSFSLDLEKFAKKAGNNAALVVKKTAIDMFSQVIRMTPVDEGRARGNWQFSVNAPANGTVDTLDKTGQFSIAGVKFGANAWKQGDIWLTNNLPYINRLEHGWSQQAPAGFVRITMREYRQHIENALQGIK